MSQFFHRNSSLLAIALYDNRHRNVTYTLLIYILNVITIRCGKQSKPGWDTQLSEMNENERITLRLGPDELRMLDDFIAENDEFENRSQLARAAIRAYIENRCAREERRAPNEVLVTLPPLVLETIKHLMEQGVYSSISEAVADCARHEFLHDEKLRQLKMDGNQLLARNQMQLVPKD